MREIEELEKLWRESVPVRGFRSSPRIQTDGLVLGVTRLLAKRDGALEFEDGEARLLTLLSVAYGRPITSVALDAIRRASKSARAGDDALAAMHLALAGLGTLVHPADAARRLFIADGLLARGIRPRDIFAPLDFDAELLDDLEKYNPDEPRNPKGSGRISGEWTREIEEAEAAVEDVVRELPRVIPRIATVATRTAAATVAAAEVVADALPPIAFVTALLIPTPAGGKRVKGDVQGRPDLFYSWNSDETALRILRRADNREVLSATLYPDGTLRQGPKRIGRKRGDDVFIDPFALPPEWPSPDDRGDIRRLCPTEQPDRPGRPEDKGGKKDRDFEDYMKLWVNPGAPTPRGYGYAFFNPSTGNFIIFEDCQKISGFLFDAKGTTYTKLLTQSGEQVRQAGRQSDQCERGKANLLGLCRTMRGGNSRRGAPRYG